MPKKETVATWIIVTLAMAAGIAPVGSSEPQPVHYEIETELAEAAYHGRLAELEHLISSGFDVDEQAWDGLTALMWAVLGAEPGCVELLIREGANLDLASDWSETALILAIVSLGHNTVPPREARDPEVVGSNRRQIVELLVESGADLELGDIQGSTPLMLAASGTDLPLVEYFIDHGANVCVVDDWGRTTVTHVAEPRIFELLVAHGADIDAQMTVGGRWNPLLWACFRGNEDIVRGLLRHGANVNIRFPEDRGVQGGESALMLARQAGYESIAQLLIAAGATE